MQLLTIAMILFSTLRAWNTVASSIVGKLRHTDTKRILSTQFFTRSQEVCRRKYFLIMQRFPLLLKGIEIRLEDRLAILFTTEKWGVSSDSIRHPTLCKAMKAICVQLSSEWVKGAIKLVRRQTGSNMSNSEGEWMEIRWLKPFWQFGNDSLNDLLRHKVKKLDLWRIL